MKLELIIPPNPYLGDDKRNAPLGLLYVASTTEKNGIEVKVSDLRGASLSTIENLIGAADAYGITASTPDYHLVKKIAEAIKLKYPSSPIILGGIHATSVPDTIDLIFDKVIIGEGERAVLSVLGDIQKGNRTRFYRANPLENLDEVPFPAYHLIPYDSAFSRNALKVGGLPAASVLASRGCPYSCSFCASRTMWPGKIRFRSVDNVVREIKWLRQEFKIENFRFQDDTMTVKSDYLKLRKKSVCFS